MVPFTLAPPKRAAALLAVVALGLAACSKSSQNQGAASRPAVPPVSVTLSPVKAMELQRSVRITGSLVGLETATLSNRVTGRVSKIYVDRGDRVKPGQKLLEIEPDRYKMAVSESEAALQQSLARVGLQKIPGDDFDVNQTAPVKKAQSEYENAKDKLDRATPLHASHAMNDFEYLDIVAVYKSAASTLENSRDEARALLAAARQNRAQLDMRSKDHEDSVIVAPLGNTPDGTPIEGYAVTDRKVSEGEYLREGTAVFTLVADGFLKLEARVPERYLADVKKGAAVNFKVEAYPNETFTGKVVIIDPAVDQANRTFLVEALVNNGQYGNRLHAGSFVPGEILTRKDSQRIMVPKEAVTSFVGVTKVFKIDASSHPLKVKAIDVTTDQEQSLKDGSDTSIWVEIAGTGKSQSLGEHDQVVVTGLTKLVDGSEVVIDTTAVKALETSGTRD